MQISKVERGDVEFLHGARNGEMFGAAGTFALDTEKGELYIYSSRQLLTIMPAEDVQALLTFLKWVSLNENPQKSEMVDTRGLPPAQQAPTDAATQF